MKALERFAYLCDAKSERDWYSLLFTIGDELGFEQVLFALVPVPGQRLEDAFIRSSYADEWRQAYDRERLHHTDPTVAHCVQRCGPLVWSPEIFTTHAQKAMYEEACAFGIRSGVTMPIHGPTGELGMITMVNDAKPGKRFHRDLSQVLPSLALLRDFAFESGARFALPAPPVENVPSLTQRELECLRWIAAGKTSWEIGRILSCSEAAVNFHITNIRRKFDVTTRHAAVVKALALGLIGI